MATERPRTMASCLPEHLIDGQSQCGEERACSDSSAREHHRDPAVPYPRPHGGMPFAQPAYGWHEKFRGGPRDGPGSCDPALQMDQLVRTFGSGCTLDQHGAPICTSPGAHNLRQIIYTLFQIMC